MASEYASQNGSRPAKVLRRDQSILAKRHLPRQFHGDSNFSFVENRNKKGKFVLISRPKVTPTHVLSKSSWTSSGQLQGAFSTSGDVSLTDTSSSNTDTSVTTLHSEPDLEQDMKQSGTEFQKDDESEASHSVSTASPTDSEESVSTENAGKPSILKMGPQDVNVLLNNEYLIELCRKYKSRCRNNNALAEMIIDWVQGKGGNFVVPTKGVFAVASFSEVDGFLQRIIESATHKKSRVPVPLPVKSKGGKKHLSAPEGSLVPSDVDVLCGRGNGFALHPGNMNFRRYCWDLREKYKNMPRQKKRILAASVIDRVKSMGGRFLEVNREVYSLATEARVLEKVCQALREKKWESRKSLLGPLYTNKSSVKKENKVPHDKAPKKSNAKVVKLSTPKKTSTTAAPSWPEQSPPKRPDTETPKAMNKEVEVGTRIEVYWPLDQKYYAAKVQAVNGHFVHLEYELDGVLEWLNLSEHIFRTIS